MPSFPRKWLIVLIVLAVAIPLLQPVLPDTVSGYRLFLVSTMMIAAIAVLGLNLLTGFNGQISLGHGAFYAVGAYTAAILMDQANAPYWATLPAAAVVCFIVGYLFSTLSQTRNALISRGVRREGLRRRLTVISSACGPRGRS